MMDELVRCGVLRSSRRRPIDLVALADWYLRVRVVNFATQDDL